MWSLAIKLWQVRENALQQRGAGNPAGKRYKSRLTWGDVKAGSEPLPREEQIGEPSWLAAGGWGACRAGAGWRPRKVNKNEKGLPQLMLSTNQIFVYANKIKQNNPQCINICVLQICKELNHPPYKDVLSIMCCWRLPVCDNVCAMFPFPSVFDPGKHGWEQPCQGKDESENKVKVWVAQSVYISLRPHGL